MALTITFYIIAFVLVVVIGFYQFYRVGGFRFVLQVAVILLIISYVAFGPYSAYYRQVKDQVKDAGRIVYRTVSNAVYDLWLLVTNPTEWYARQQALNVRPERPVDFPKGIEIISFESLPPAVAGGQAFALTAVVRNDGSLTAEDVSVQYGCNYWCDAKTAKPSDYDTSRSHGTKYVIDSRIERGESTIITVSPFTATFLRGREAETNFARVYFNLSYVYSTNSSLKLTVMNEDELKKRFREGETVFKPVVAISKSTPAQLSLNVGPQPLKEGTNALLLVSVSNSRDNSKVVLKKGTHIIVRMPEFLAQSESFECGRFKPVSGKLPDGSNNPDYRKGYYTIVYETDADSIEILPYEFRSIFSFLCNFKTPSAISAPSATGLIVAEIPAYGFILEQKKDIPITPSLGVVFDPYDKVCRDITEESACNAKTSADGTCYYEPGDSRVGNIIRGTSGCRSCGANATRDCSQFSQSVCSSAGARCGLECEWDPDYVNPDVSTAAGICAKARPAADAPLLPKTALSGSIAQRLVQAARAAKATLPTSVDSDVRSQGLGNSFEELVLKLSKVESNGNGEDFRHCCETDANRYNTCKASGVTACTAERTLISYDDSSVGVMQIFVNTRPTSSAALKAEREPLKLPGAPFAAAAGCAPSETVYDMDCNIKLGMKILVDSYNANKGGKYFRCSNRIGTKDITYTGWEAAVRGYNGYGCGPGADPLYVDRVKRADVFRYMVDPEQAEIWLSYSPASPKSSDTITFDWGLTSNWAPILGPGGYRTELVIDSRSVLICRESGSTFSVCYADQSLTTGSHTYSANLLDSAGNIVKTKSATISVAAVAPALVRLSHSPANPKASDIIVLTAEANRDAIGSGYLISVVIRQSGSEQVLGQCSMTSTATNICSAPTSLVAGDYFYRADLKDSSGILKGFLANNLHVDP